MTHPDCIFVKTMPFICLFTCGTKPRKKVAPNRKTRREDFRRADPNYTSFVPKTCRDAIDLFNRHRALGLQADLYPECFVHCAKQLPDEELDMFHRFIVCPTRDIQKGGEKPTLTDIELEKERLMLLKESEERDQLTGGGPSPDPQAPGSFAWLLYPSDAADEGLV